MTDSTVKPPKAKTGPKKGFKQSPEHIARRKMWGAANPKWKGDAALVNAGRQRARRIYQHIGPCSGCGALRGERHHRDGNTHNNDSANIAVLCRRCHMATDGRLSAFLEMARAQQPKAVAARIRSCRMAEGLSR